MAKGSEIFRGVLEAARKQLKLDFDAAKGFSHRGIRGSEREEAFGNFLRSRLPPSFGVSTGEVIDRRDRRTGQLDLIVYDQTVTRAIYAGYSNELYPCEAVYAVVEVKSVFTKSEAESCLKAAKKVRALRPYGEKFVNAREKGEPIDKGAHRCMYLVFAYQTDLSEKDWLTKEYERLVSVAAEEDVSPALVDRLVVLDRGIINPVKGQGRSGDKDPTALFAESFLHLVNFIERERKRRPPLSWQTYALPQSKGWRPLKKNKESV